MNIDVHVDTVVVDGIRLSGRPWGPTERQALEEGLRAELARMIALPETDQFPLGAVVGTTAPAARRTARGPDLQAGVTDPALLGTLLAGSVWEAVIHG